MEIIPIQDVVYTEKVDFTRMKSIQHSMEQCQSLNKPITVDRRRMFVINGHHRISALQCLGITKIAVYLVDYEDESIQLDARSSVRSKVDFLRSVENGELLRYKDALHTIDGLPINHAEKEICVPLRALKDIVVTFGVFDLFHKGHMNVIKQMCTHGNHVVVFVHSDAAVRASKGRSSVHHQDTRIDLLRSMAAVDEVHLYEDVYHTVRHHPLFRHTTTLACGEDQCHQSFQNAMEHIKRTGGSVVRMQRTAGVSTTSLRLAE